MFEINGKFTSAKVMIDDVEESCVGQIVQFVNHPVFTNPIAIMPDTHAGKGSVIGFTMKLTDRVIPNVVGVDIGCGMLSFEVDEINTTIEELDRKIRQKIPFGQEIHENAMLHMEREFPWHETNVLAEKFVRSYRERGQPIELIRFDMRWFLEKCEQIGGGTRRIINSIGTLGGGNHFIETGISQATGRHWITIHSGSRNFGKRICEYWQSKAVKRVKKDRTDDLKIEIDSLRNQYQGDELYRKIQEVKTKHHIGVDTNGLEWLEGEEMHEYLFDMIFAQMYAQVNRHTMMYIIRDLLNVTIRGGIETVHNFIDFNDLIIRKGAIRSYIGETMIIPFNMRDGILVCEGRSNAMWNFSAPHGAGRVMSRSQAKRSIDLELFREQMKGIYSTSVGMGTLDESPDAYKDAKIIEEAIDPTATIIDRIKPIHNMKDSLGKDD